MASEVAAIYRSSKKKRDINWFTEWIARPPAALVVYVLRGTPITPNQVTFLSAFVAAGACAMLIACLGWVRLVIAAALFEFSFVLDCADGMLARLRKLASPLGHLLDFLMDELKAMLLYGARRGPAVARDRRRADVARRPRRWRSASRRASR